MADGMRGWARLWRATRCHIGLAMRCAAKRRFKLEFRIVSFDPDAAALWLGHSGLERAVLLLSLLVVPDHGTAQ